MIKKIVFIAAMGAMGLLWGSADVTIQVINAVKERSITAEFDKKLAKSGLDVHKVVEGGRYIVTLGSYKDEKAAQTALKKARMVVCKEAFIRPVKRDQVAMASAEAAKCAKPAETASAPVTASPVQAVAKVEAPVGEQHAEAKVVVAVVTHEVKQEQGVIALSDFEKKEAYKIEIAEAINYYKHSPYHRFEPVTLRQ